MDDEKLIKAGTAATAMADRVLKQYIKIIIPGTEFDHMFDTIGGFKLEGVFHHPKMLQLEIVDKDYMLDFYDDQSDEIKKQYSNMMVQLYNSLMLMGCVLSESPKTKNLMEQLGMIMGDPQSSTYYFKNYPDSAKRIGYVLKDF